MHVVGSTQGHPEMLWSTFEHFGNTPLAAYQYNNSAGTQTVSPAASGTWLFSSSGAPATPNVSHADYTNAPNITGVGGDVTPSDTQRVNPFGTPPNLTNPNPGDASSAAANTELISLNNNIAQMMASSGASADVRNNYFQSGTTWTKGGAFPSGPYFSGGNEVGTNELANSTMETYHQTVNCFYCHASNQTDVSHMYPVLLPLF